MGATFWSSRIEKLVKDNRPSIRGSVEGIQEDWGKKTVSFSIDSASSAVELPFEFFDRVAQLLGTKEITIEARGDNRYADQGDAGASISFLARNVKFPEVGQ